ncbi:MAG TPA: hypothetical protein VD963_00710, partial [Phycisphaerales bacterium]|nr:hypothetical protein [Phycisphaerales bacterium]
MSATGRNWMVAGAGVLAGTLGLASGPAGCARHGLDRGEDVPVARLVADGGWDAGTMLEVENVRGGVVVRVDPDAGAVRTRATARPTERPWYDRLGVADGDVAEAVAITSVLEQSDAGPVVRVTARQNEPEEGPTGRAAAVDLVITTPPVAGVRVTTRDGRVELAGVSGRVEVHVGGAAGGPIEMRTAGALVGPVALGTTRGDVLLQVTDEAGAQVEM